MIKVGDRVRWHSEGVYEVVLAVTSTHAFVVWTGDGGTAVQRVPLSELTLVESAPEVLPIDPEAEARFERLLSAKRQTPQPTLVEEALKQRESLLAENARLREALQAWVSNSPNEYRNQHDRMLYAKCLALGIRPKETP
jgi:hypothetical protein